MHSELFWAAFASSRCPQTLTLGEGKPAALAATAANAGSTPKKSIDATPKLGEAEAAAAPAAESSAAPARAGSSSSSSSDEEKNKKKKAKSKSRSVSRGKRTSIFGGFLGKKDKVEEKAEEKKEKAEEKLEDKKEGEAAAAPAEGTFAIRVAWLNHETD